MYLLLRISLVLVNRFFGEPDLLIAGLLSSCNTICFQKNQCLSLFCTTDCICIGSLYDACMMTLIDIYISATSQLNYYNNFALFRHQLISLAYFPSESDITEL